MTKKRITSSADPRHYAELIGDPAEAGPATLIHRYWLHKAGIDADYRSRRIPAGSLIDSMANLRDYLARARENPWWHGCTLLSPLKEAAAALVDRRRPMAARLGIVDLIVRDGGTLVGCNSAAIGFMAPLLRRLEALPVRRALLIGAGCHARTIAHVLDDFGLDLVIANRTPAQARRLVAELGRKDRHRAVPLKAAAAMAGEIGLLVNATPLGGTGQPPFPLTPETLLPGALVYDLVRDPLETDLLDAARRRGLTTIHGLEMLIGQTALSFEGLFGTPAPRTWDDQLSLLLVP